MKTVIDDSGLLLRFAEEGNGPEVPRNCDLVPGRYRWHADRQQWWPVTPEFVPEEQPDALRAIYAGFRALQAAGIDLPPDTVAWLDFYATSIDNVIRRGG